MNGSIAFLTVKRDVDLLSKAYLDAVSFRVVHCKNYCITKSYKSFDKYTKTAGRFFADCRGNRQPRQ